MGGDESEKTYITYMLLYGCQKKIEVASERDKESQPERAMIVRRLLALRLYGACECNHEIGQKSQSLSHLFVFLLLLSSKTGFVS